MREMPETVPGTVDRDIDVSQSPLSKTTLEVRYGWMEFRAGDGSLNSCCTLESIQQFDGRGVMEWVKDRGPLLGFVVYEEIGIGNHNSVGVP